jgi:chromosome partitioning protein
MPVVTITSRKGGCGKTLLATALAAALVERGADVVLLDADPNGTAHTWATQIREGTPLPVHAEADAERLADLLPTLAERHQILIVDTAGFGNQAAAVAAAAADLVLVPVTPGQGDIAEAVRTLAYVNGLARSTRRTIPALVVANRLRRQTTLSRHVLAEIEAAGLPRLQSSLGEAVAYGEMSFSGRLPSEGVPADEIAALLDEVAGVASLLPVNQGTGKVVNP